MILVAGLVVSAQLMLLHLSLQWRRFSDAPLAFAELLGAHPFLLPYTHGGLHLMLRLV